MCHLVEHRNTYTFGFYNTLGLGAVVVGGLLMGWDMDRGRRRR